MTGGLLPKLLDPRRRKRIGSGPPATATIEAGGGSERPALDLENSLLVDEVAVSEIIAEGEDGPREDLYAVELRGRVWRTEDRAALLHLLGPETAGVVLASLVVAARRDVRLRKALEDALDG